jgi:hypothetical protein
LITDEIKLIKKQNELDKSYRLQLTGKSMYDTIGDLIKKGLFKEAEELRKDFKISDSDKRYFITGFLKF